MLAMHLKIINLLWPYKSTHVRFIVPWSKPVRIVNGYNESWFCFDPQHTSLYEFFTDHNKVLIIHPIVGVVL